MNYTNVLSKAWRLVWNLRGLWFFGFVLAVTTTSGSYLLWNNRDEQAPNGITIKFSEDNSIKIFGEGLNIDLTRPEAPKVFVRWDENTWLELKEVGAELKEMMPGDMWTILIFAAVELGILLLVGLVGRYISEAAVMRGVLTHEQSGQTPTFIEGWRLGWSRAAGRLFMIDVIISLTAGILLMLLLALAFSPLLLWLTDSTDAGVLGIALTTMLLLPWCGLLVLTLVGSSLLRQLSWRASSLEGLGVIAAIQRGLKIARVQLKDTFLTWLVWMTTKLAWLLAVFALMVLLAPAILATIVLGAILAALPALVTLGIAGSTMQGITPWILAGLTALPVFILVAASPVTFLGGLVRLFQSNIWTLAYRELSPARQARQPAEKGSQAQGMEVAPA
ncbi:MAG TPA: hypothetical protein VLA49_19210 [Anaerolineales bacterium]|nr:hypothetical protein [Anaerolineales bacterium]